MQIANIIAWQLVLKLSSGVVACTGTWAKLLSWQRARRLLIDVQARLIVKYQTGKRVLLHVHPR